VEDALVHELDPARGADRQTETPTAQLALPAEPRLEAAVVVVIPCYRVARFVEGVVRTIPPFVRHIVVVDDCCPQASGDVVNALGDPRVVVLRHDRNRGVGGAMKTGFAKALELQATIVVKVDGDGQMDPTQIARLCRPLIERRAAYAKYNRFWDFKALRQMPRIRRVGNVGLSFLTKVASGHWRVFDPTNGFVAIRGDVLGVLDLASLADGYFFETSMLIELGKRGFRVADLPLAARYGDEESSMSITRVLFTFPFKLAWGTVVRVWFRHFWFDFTLAALLLLLGIPQLVFGFVFGLTMWWRSLEQGVPATAGTVMLAGLPLILGVIFLLQAVTLEVSGAFSSRVTLDE
jgi:dolichol-phosphate mannosyltransferase